MGWKRFEIALIIFCCIAIATKILDVPTTGVLTILSFSLYALYSISKGIFDAIKATTTIARLNHFFSNAAIALCSISIMYIFMSFSNARFLLLTGGISAALLFVIFKALDSSKQITLGKRTIVWSTIVIAIWLLPKYTIFKLKHLKDPELVELYIEKEETKTLEARKAFSDYIDELWKKRRSQK